MSVNRCSGKVLWSKGSRATVGFSSCGRRYSHNRGLRGHLRAYGVQQPDVEPIEIWRVEIGGCLEATPTVWRAESSVPEKAGCCAGRAIGVVLRVVMDIGVCVASHVGDIDYVFGPAGYSARAADSQMLCLTVARLSL